MSKDFDKTDPFQQRTYNDLGMETDDVNGVAPRGAQPRPEEEMQRRHRLTDEEILRLLPKSQPTNQHVQRLYECKMKECTAVATKECSGYCTGHFCELYRSGKIDIPVPGSLKQAAALGYGDKSSSDEPGHPHRERARSATRQTSSGSGGNTLRTSTVERRRRAKSTGRTSRTEGKSVSSSEDDHRPVECVGPLCKNISYSESLCDECKAILTAKNPTPKGDRCTFLKCKKLSSEKGKLCKACHETRGMERAKWIPPQKPNEAYPARRQPRSSSPLARNRVDLPREDPLLKINTPPALHVMVNVGQVGPYNGARPRTGGTMDRRHDAERHSQLYSTRDVDDRRHRHGEPHGRNSQRIQRYDEREPAMPNYHHMHRHEEREPAMPNYHNRHMHEEREQAMPNYQHRRMHEETAYERLQRSNRNREEYGGTHDVRHCPSDIVTESSPSSFMTDTNPSSVQEEESHPSLNALSINDWPPRNHRKKTGNEGNRRRNASGNKHSSVPDIPPRKRCENPRCDPWIMEEYGGTHDVRHCPSDIVTESSPSSFMTDTNPSSVQEEESHPSLNAPSINDWPLRNHRKKTGNEGNRSRNESGNEYSSVTDIPPRKRCENPRCENYGNVRCGGFCNSCYSRLRR